MGETVASDDGYASFLSPGFSGAPPEDDFDPWVDGPVIQLRDHGVFPLPHIPPLAEQILIASQAIEGRRAALRDLADAARRQRASRSMLAAHRSVPLDEDGLLPGSIPALVLSILRQPDHLGAGVISSQLRAMMIAEEPTARSRGIYYHAVRKLARLRLVRSEPTETRAILLFACSAGPYG